MNTLKTIEVHGLQSMHNVIIELPEYGLIAFTGPNSNGKSIITKILEDVVNGNLGKPKERKSIITRKQASGWARFSRYDGMSLLVNIDLEASKTFLEITRSSGEVIRRYLADKTIPALLEEFGIHYLEQWKTSLNIHDSEKPTLFFKTPHRMNFDVVSSSQTDAYAEKVLSQLELNMTELASLKQTFTKQLDVAKTALSGIELYNTDKETERIEKLTECLGLLSHVYIPYIREMIPVPDVTIISLPTVRLRPLNLITFIILPKVSLRDVSVSAAALKEAMEGVCPACHRPFYS